MDVGGDGERVDGAGCVDRISSLGCLVACLGAEWMRADQWYDEEE